MKRDVVCLYLALFFCIAGEYPSNVVLGGQMWQQINLFSNTSLNELSFQSNVSRCVEECAILCNSLYACRSFSYDTSSRRCIQLDCALGRSTHNLISRPGSFYFIRQEDNHIHQSICPVESGYLYNSALHVCYKVVMEKTTWFDSRANCEHDEGHLLLINSQAIQDWVVTLFSGLPEKHIIHIDGNDVATQGEYIAHDGCPLTWYNWSHDQPNNRTSDDCLAMAVKWSFKWLDHYCSGSPNRPESYICQIDIN